MLLFIILSIVVCVGVGILIGMKLESIDARKKEHKKTHRESIVKELKESIVKELKESIAKEILNDMYKQIKAKKNKEAQKDKSAKPNLAVSRKQHPTPTITKNNIKPAIQKNEIEKNPISLISKKESYTAYRSSSYNEINTTCNCNSRGQCTGCASSSSSCANPALRTFYKNNGVKARVIRQPVRIGRDLAAHSPMFGD